MSDPAGNADYVKPVRVVLRVPYAVQVERSNGGTAGYLVSIEGGTADVLDVLRQFAEQGADMVP